MHYDVIIIGGGLAGLSCARELSKRNISWCLLEASDRTGGRVATDETDGFLLDRGFQILLDAYPEAQAVLDYGELNLRPFYAGARIWLGQERGFATIANPLQHPEAALSTLFAPIGSLLDKIKILGLRNRAVKSSLQQIFTRPEERTRDFLRSRGFSDTVMQRFFQPFFGGVFFDTKLHTSTRMFDFVFRMFSTGAATLPAAGMGQIPRQITAALPQERVWLNTAVTALQGTTVHVQSGEQITAKTIVLATDWLTTATLANMPAVARPSCGTTCVYFAAPTPPFHEPILVLNGTGKGLINNLCVPSNSAPLYAPRDQALVSVSIVGVPQTDEITLIGAVRKELNAWYGTQVQSWRHLRTYNIPFALPEQIPPALTPAERPVKISDTLYLCGDHRDTASIHGAMVSGRRTAEEIAKHLA